ncbi:hypothetical protein SPB21_18870 [Leptothoe sp. ISB3NOV94-8A]
MSGSTPIFQRGEKYVRGENQTNTYQIIVNEEAISPEYAYLSYYSRTQKGLGSLCIFSKEGYYKTSNYTIDELTNSFEEIYIYDLFSTNSFEDFWIDSISVRSGSPTSREPAYREKYIEFKFEIDIVNWKKVWSLKEHFNNFHSYINGYELKFNSPEDCGLLGIQSDHSNTNPVEYDIFTTFINDYGSFTLKDFLNRCIEIFKKANSEVLDKYQSSLTTYSLTERFNFPPEVKTACEQYLLYFAEFLNDIAGIEVDTSLSPDGESTIFAVQPRNREEALDTIGQYLKAYLQFPGSELINKIQVSSDLSLQAQSLKIQVDNLKNQLDIANLKRQMIGAVIELKDQSIQDKNAEISRLGQQLQENQITIRVLAESLQKKEDEESILGDALKVKDYEAPGGLVIGTPDIVRRVKRFLGLD